MILVSPPYRHELRVSFSRLRHDPAGSYSTSCGTPLYVHYVRCVSTPEIFGDVSVNHSRTGSVKLLITRRDEQSSKPSSAPPGPFADYSLSPVPNWAAIQPPPPKGLIDLRLAYLLSSCLVGNAGYAVGEPWTPGEPTWPRPGLFVDRSYATLCWPALPARH